MTLGNNINVHFINKRVPIRASLNTSYIAQIPILKKMLWFLYNKYDIIMAQSTLLAGLKQRKWSKKVMRMIAQ